MKTILFIIFTFACFQAQSHMTIYTIATIYDQKLKDKPMALKYYKRYLEAKPTQEQESYVRYSKFRVEQLGK